ncbi:hypothetical protein FRX31_035170 [Thalictrum thalictroides]|uniref:Transmembrane protein n=1 Tax=Thalictrum thalictroides TaxID=46969 RepID=A0A7J6URT5_THATH|nr:hypothetical protein FRX31_035167 [Thalictrum thalictroides]KAF5175250.1 hypothetical protein FRX31_035170 [Thalictrum thalictroides]
MGRRIPPHTNYASIHPVVSFSLLTAFVAATIVVIAALCGARARSRKSKPLSSPSSTLDTANVETTATTSTAAKLPPPSPPPTKLAVETDNPPEVQQELPSILTQKANETSEALTVKRHRRKLSASLSMKAGGMALARMLSRKEEHQQVKQKQSKPEDSIWTKKILLGEKCRVPDEDDDAIFYDERGNRLSSYPVKTPRSVPVSRSNSFIDKDSLPS